MTVQAKAIRNVHRFSAGALFCLIFIWASSLPLAAAGGTAAAAEGQVHDSRITIVVHASARVNGSEIRLGDIAAIAAPRARLRCGGCGRAAAAAAARHCSASPANTRTVGSILQSPKQLR